jgi:hypothetical protein
MYFVSPKAGEKYFLRLLLCHVKGAKSYADMLKLEGKPAASNFRQACIERGLLEDDMEWDRCLNEVKENAFAPQLRSLFAIILEYNAPERPAELWAKYLPWMMDDKLRAVEDMGLPLDEAARARCANAALWDVEQLLRPQGLSVGQFHGMPTLHRIVGPEVMSEFMRAELCYDREELQWKSVEDIARVSKEL